MKLYIPTTVLNVDNILSTESIAPFAYYALRDYGYNKFYQLPWENYKYNLLLYSKIPFYQLDHSELDHYPVVVEVDTSSFEERLKNLGNHSGVDVYAINEPIRLSPFNCRLFFMEGKAFNLAKNYCSDSLSNKLSQYFDFCPNLVQGEFSLLQIVQHVQFDDEVNEIEAKSKQDNDLNKVKGFIYGYYFGACQSVSPTIAELLKLQQRVYDIVAAVKSNDGRIEQVFQQELKDLDRNIKEKDTSFELSKKLWADFATKYGLSSDTLNAILQDLKIESDAKNHFLKDNGIVFMPSMKDYGSNLDKYSLDLECQVKSLARKEQASQIESFAVKNEFDLTPNYSQCMLLKNDSVSMLFNKLIWSFVWENDTITPEKLRTNRSDYAKQYVLRYRDIHKEEGRDWDDSEERKYLNTFRQNIEQFTPFSLSQLDNIVLQSFCAFVQKGEDYEALCQYLRDNAISDYRYALALWGGLIGYVKMPRTIFEKFSRVKDFSRVYSDVLKLLLGANISGELPTTFAETPIPPKQPKPTTTNKSIEEWHDYILSCAEKVIKQNKPKLIHSLEEALKQNGENQDNFVFITILDNFDGWRPTGSGPSAVWTRMQELICPEYETRLGPPTKTKTTTKQKKKKVVEEKSLFDSVINGIKDIFSPKHDETIPERNLTESIITNPNTSITQEEKLLLNDISWIEACSQFIFEDRAKKQFLDDMEWFIGNHQETYMDKKRGNVPGRYYGHDTSNERTIERLSFYLEIQHTSTQPNMQWKVDIYRNVDFSPIIEYLKRRYVE